MPRPRGMLRDKGMVGGYELMRPLRCSRGRGQAEATTDPTSAGAVALLMPHPVDRENGNPPLSRRRNPAGDEGKGHIPSPVTELVPSPGLDPFGYHFGDAPAHYSFGVLSGISQGHIATDPTNLSALGALPPLPPSDPVSTSCRCVGQSKKPGNALRSAPLYQVCSCPSPAHQRLPKLSCL